MTERKRIPAALLKRIEAVTNKRARFVLDTIVARGSCSTVDIKEAGYDHPPCAKRDAIELGFALRTQSTLRSDGQRVAQYFFDDRELDPLKTGRVIMSKKDRLALIASKGDRCNACGSSTNLQIDHRIPYEVAGESQASRDDPFQVLDGVCNRRKSWACEHCENWITLKSFEVCLNCYWARPEAYIHVAMRPERRFEAVFTGHEIRAFDELQKLANDRGHSVQKEIIELIKRNSEHAGR